MPYKVIDAHGHVNAPPQLYAYKSGLLASSGVHGQGSSGVTEELLAPIVKRHVEGTLDKVGTDVQFLSPRPFQLMHSERPAKIVDWWCKANNDAIAMSVKLAPDRYRGVCGLPQVWGESPRNCLEELERCVVEMGFVGCMIDPDPSEGQDLNVPTMENEYWYPLYEKMVELDVPALMHTAACKNSRESYSNHFITEESIQVLAMANSKLFEDFPNLKIIVCHGGGSIPYHIGRWRATRIRQREFTETFDESIKKLYYDTVLYNQESLELLFKIIGTDRCMFGTENPGTGSAQDPVTGKWLDDTKPDIEGISWLTEEDKANVFENVARAAHPRFKD